MGRCEGGIVLTASKDKVVTNNNALGIQNGTASARLLRIDVAVIPRTICNARDAYGGLVGTAMICAGSMLGGYDSCQVGQSTFLRIVKIEFNIDPFPIRLGRLWWRPHLFRPTRRRRLLWLWLRPAQFPRRLHGPQSPHSVRGLRHRVQCHKCRCVRSDHHAAWRRRNGALGSSVFGNTADNGSDGCCSCIV